VTTHRLVADKLAFIFEFRVLSFIRVDTVFNITSELADKPLNWPSSRITQCANSVAFNLLSQLLEHIDFSEVSVTDLEAFEDVDHPAGALTARSALTARLVRVEFSES